MSAPASPLLSYSLLCSVGSTDGVTYVDAGQPATLTLVVSNPGSAVTLDSLTLNFSLGTDATDLTASEGNITTVLPSSQWTSAWGANGLTLTPPGGSLVVGTTTGLTFDFQVSAVNSIVGTTQVGVIETTSTQTAYPPAFAIPMVPAGFVLANLSASPVQIDSGATVTLSWVGTPNQVYTVNYVGGPAAGVSVTAPSGGSVSWVSPPIETTETSAAFVVSAIVQSVTVEASTTVLVSAPQILTFPPPGVSSYGDPLPLQWTTASATHCELYLNGLLLDARAPANTPAAGYPVTPTAPQNTCQLIARNGSAQSLPVQITLAARLWNAGQTLSGLDAAATNSLALSAGGDHLYAGGSTGGGCLCAISTSSMTVATQAPNMSSSSIGAQALAVSSDGTQLYVGITATGDEGSFPFILAYPLPSLDLPPFSPVFSIGTMLTLDAAAGVLYSASGSSGSSNSQTAFCSLIVSSQTFGAPALAPTGAPAALQLSHGGNTLYALIEAPGSASPGTVYVLATSSFAPVPSLASARKSAIRSMTSAQFASLLIDSAAPSSTAPTQIDGLGTAGLALGPQGAPNEAVLYGCAADGSASLVPISVPANTPQTAIPLFRPTAGATASLIGLGAEPSGGIFAAVVVSGLAAPVGQVANGLNVFVLNPYTQGVGFVYNNPALTTATSAAFVSDATGAHVYCAAAGTIVQLVQESASPSTRATSDHAAASSSHPA